MKFTASKSPLLTQCLYPFRSDVDVPEAPSDPYARIGTVVWARLAAHVDRAPDPGNGDGLAPGDVATVDELVAIGRRWLVERRAGMIAPRTEVKYAWAPARDAARELPPTKELRDYSAALPDEVTGSVDLVYDEDGSLVVEDVKTGHTALAQYLPQARTLGLFVARALGRRRVKVRLTKLALGEAPATIEQTLDAFALVAIAADLYVRLEAAAAAEPSPGSHCTEMFCPARLACPAVASMVGELIPADALVHAPRFSHAFVSHEHDASMLEFLRVVEKAAKDLRDRIKARTPREGVQLSDGRWFGEGSHDETKWSQDQLIAKARELGAKAGLTAEDLDRELEACRYIFAKSEGLKVTKNPPKLASRPRAA